MLKNSIESAAHCLIYVKADMTSRIVIKRH